MEVGSCYCGMVFTKKEVRTKYCTRYTFSACVPDIMDEFGYSPAYTEFMTFTVYHYLGLSPRYYIKTERMQDGVYYMGPMRQVIISGASLLCRELISYIKADLGIRLYKGV